MAEPRRNKIKKALMSKTAFITTRFSKANLLAFSVVFAIIGGYFIYNAFAATTLYVSASGSNANPCTQTAPCASFARAYQVAAPGDVVKVTAGTYPAQRIDQDSSKTSSDDVIFEPSGGTVTVDGMLSLGVYGGSVQVPGAQHITFRSIKVNGFMTTNPGADDVTFENMDAGALNISGSSTQGVKVLGGDFGPWNDGVSHIKQGASNVLVDGAVFHDFTITDPEKHSECMMLWGGVSYVTVRNSIFRNCTDFGVLVKGANNITFENNFFDRPMPGETSTIACNPGCPRSGNSLALSEGSTMTIRHNSMLGGLRRDPEVTNVTLTDNLVNASPSLFVDGNDTDGTIDLHLAAGVSAINAGSSALPSTDIDGQTRPATGTAPDLGADEYGGTTTTPPPTDPIPPPPPPPSGEVYSDDFERALLGANWTVTNGVAGIVNNSNFGLMSGITTIAQWNAAMPADQFSEAVISDGQPPDQFARGVFIRRAATSAARYQFHYDFNGTDADPRPQWQIKYDGVPTAQTRLLAVTTTPGAPKIGDTLKIQASGSTITGYWNGNQILSATDTVLTSGTAGLALTTGGTTVTSPLPGFASWRGGAISSTTPTPTISLTANPASIASGSSSTLSWSSTNATSCSASGAWTGTKATSGSQSVTPTATSIYNLSCTGAGGTATASTTVIVSTTPPPSPSDTTLPTVDITSPLAGSTVSGTVNAAASASDNVGVSRVDFLVNGTLAGSDTTSPYNYAWNTTTLANGTHTITAKAYDAAGNNASDQVAVNVSNGDTTPPSTPTGLTATASAYNRVNLSWTAASDNVGVTGYYIVRNGVTIAQSTDTSHADSTVSGSTSYSYQVMATDAKGNTSALSSTASVTTPAAPDTAPPSTPAGLTATAVSTSQINLSWTPSTDNIGVTGYDVYRSTAGSTAAKVATVTTTSFGNTGLSASTTYSYYVIARDAAGNTSGQSNTATATTQALPPPPPATTTGSLTGLVTSSATSSGLDRATISTYVGTVKWTTKTTSTGQYSLPNLPAGSYSVRYAAKHHLTQTKTANITDGQTTTLNVVLVRR